MAYILLSREAYFHNLDIIAQKVGGVSKIAVVLKDNAYGHGICEMAGLAREYGVKDAVVHNVAEACQIAPFFERILILGGREYAADEKMLFAVNSLAQIAGMPEGCRIELKVDTGMHRNGIAMDEVGEALSLIHDRGLVLKGGFTHNRSADTLSSEWFWQRKNFEKVKSEILGLQAKYGFDTPRFHSSNSASAFRYTNFDEDLVRVGIAAYGCLEMAPTLEQPDLKPVLALKAKKIATRRLRRGEHVGYNATFRAENEMTISTYDVGYADGLHRSASNRYATPEGEQLLGRVSMDNSSYTGERDELLIFDDVNRYAKAAGTIGYEILTGLRPEIERKII